MKKSVFKLSTRIPTPCGKPLLKIKFRAVSAVISVEMLKNTPFYTEFYEYDKGIHVKCRSFVTEMSLLVRVLADNLRHDVVRHQKVFHRMLKSLWKDFFPQIADAKKYAGIRKNFGFSPVVENFAKNRGEREGSLWINRRKILENGNFSIPTRKKVRQTVIHNDIPTTFFPYFSPQSAKKPCGNRKKAVFQPTCGQIFGR